MLGFAMRAGRVLIGTEQICKALGKVGKGEPRLVLVSHTASESTAKKLLYKCEYYKKDIITVDIDVGELGRLLGKSFGPAAVAVTDEGFAKEIKQAHENYVTETTRETISQRKEVST